MSNITLPTSIIKTDATANDPSSVGSDTSIKENKNDFKNELQKHLDKAEEEERKRLQGGNEKGLKHLEKEINKLQVELDQINLNATNPLNAPNLMGNNKDLLQVLTENTKPQISAAAEAGKSSNQMTKDGSPKDTVSQSTSDMM